MAFVDNLVGKVIALTIIVILIATAALPVISDSQTTLLVEENNAGLRYYATEQVTSETEITIPTGTDFVIDGVTFEAEQYDIVLVSSSLCVRVINNAYQVVDFVNAMHRTVTAISIASDGTYTTNDPTCTGTIEGTVIIASPTGDYGLFPSGVTLKINEDSKLYSYGRFQHETDQVAYLVEGTITNMSLAALYDVTSQTALTPSNFTLAVNDEKVTPDAHNVSYSVVNTGLLSITHDEVTVTIPSLVLFAPVSYDVVGNSQHYTLLGVLPILMIIAAVLFTLRIYRN